MTREAVGERTEGLGSTPLTFCSVQNTWPEISIRSYIIKCLHNSEIFLGIISGGVVIFIA